MPEPRTAVMIMVEASWQDQNGTLRTVPARMEDKSIGGACIRLKTRIRVGSKLRIQGRWERFSGVARYCRIEGREYVVGMQREPAKSPTLDQPVPKGVLLQDVLRRDVPLREGMRSGALAVSTAVSTAKIPSPPKPMESQPSEVPAAQQIVETAPITLLASGLPAMPARAIGHELGLRVRPRISQPQDSDAFRRTELRTEPPPKGEEADKERKPMRRKWLQMAPWHNKQDGLSASGAGSANGGASHNLAASRTSAASRDAHSNGNSEKENLMQHVAAHTEKTPAHPAKEEVANFQIELLPMEDIYRAAGIMMPRKGYSINKVVEMLHSEHIRALSKEMKRVAVLMALDAAGIPIDEVLQDAKARQDALNTYEAEQKKRAEAEWAHKVEENVQIQAELERVKAHHMARITRNLDAVAREKATFGDWLTIKQQESQSMTEAAELCLKPPVPEAASAPPLEFGVVQSSAKLL